MNTKIITLDVNKKLYEPIIAKQGDTNSRFLLFNLYDNSTQLNLSGRTVRAYAIKPDSNPIYNDLVINDATKGICTLELTTQLLAVEGYVNMELVITEGTKKLSTIPFTLKVIGSLNSEDAVISTNEFTLLQEALAQVQNIDNRFTEVNVSLETISNEKVDIGYFKKEDKDGFIDTTNYTVDDYYNLYQSLVNASRFDWINLGKDQSGTYDIRMYRYVPTNYNNTIFVTCSLHGWEHYGAYMMYEVFKTLLNDETLLQQYHSLRDTRILCIPISNPWGLMADNHTGVNATRRGNSRGVDLNRNFNYNWDNNTGNFGLSKGDFPFSEVETQYIRNILESYNITHYLDLHSFNNTGSETRDYLIYGNPEMEKNIYQFTNWLLQLYPSANIEHIVTENDSSANNYSNRVRNIRSMNIELIKGKGTNLKWYEMLINYLALQSKSHSALTTNTDKGLKFYQRLAQNGQSWVVPTTWTNIDNLSMTLSPHVNGIVTVHGFITVEITGGDMTTTLTFSPNISQTEFFTTKLNTARSKPFIKNSSGSVYIPFSCSMPVRKGFGDIIFNIEVIKEGTGTITLKRSDATYIYMPCELTDYQLNQHDKVVPW